MPLMPAGCYEPVVRLLMKINPQSILDIGAGMGTTGVMARQFLDIYSDNKMRCIHGKWARRLVGVEIFRSYGNPMMEYLYDEVRWGDAREEVPRILKEEKFHAALLTCILEHMEKPEALKLLATCLDGCENVIVGVPDNYLGKPGIVFDNEAERHKSLWSAADFPNAAWVGVYDRQVMVWLKGKNWVDRRPPGWVCYLENKADEAKRPWEK